MPPSLDEYRRRLGVSSTTSIGSTSSLISSTPFGRHGRRCSGRLVDDAGLRFRTSERAGGSCTGQVTIRGPDLAGVQIGPSRGVRQAHVHLHLPGRWAPPSGCSRTTFLSTWLVPDWPPEQDPAGNLVVREAGLQLPLEIFTELQMNIDHLSQLPPKIRMVTLSSSRYRWGFDRAPDERAPG